MGEYVQIKPSVYVPLGLGFFKQTRAQTIVDLLGPQWKLRLLLPVRGIVDVTAGIAPRPSATGIQALRARIDQVEREGVKHEVKSCRDLGINPGPKAPTNDDA